MAGEKVKTLRVAAVQMESKNALVRANLEHAGPFVEEAAQRGAKLVVLPEFMPTGYLFTRAIWDAAETREGLTVQWLKETSRRFSIYLGTSFLEADGEEFFNSFVLANPDGTEAGRVRKQTPAAFEAYFTRGAPGSHVIDTDFGRVGVGICYENMLSYTPRLMSTHAVDIMLMPHSAPCPMKSILTPQSAVRSFLVNLEGLAVSYAQLLGIPAVMINKSGPWDTPLPGIPFLTQHSYFPGLSAVADSDGTLKAQLGGDEGLIVEDVVLDPSRKTHAVPAYTGRWVKEFHWGIRIWRLVETVGRTWYTISAERKRRAREVSSGR